MKPPVGVLLLTYGSATTSQDVAAYLEHVRPGNGSRTELVEEFQRRYDRIGSSPLIPITLRQGKSLQHDLDRQFGTGAYHVAVGMLHSAPFIAEAVDEVLELGATTIIMVLLSPQFSPVLMQGYVTAVEQAVEEKTQASGIEVNIVPPQSWSTNVAFIRSLASKVNEALLAFPEDAREHLPIIFTAHSLPRSVVERDTAYLDQIHATVDAVAKELQLDPARWQFAYQSAGHTPEEWLKPDVKELFPELVKQGYEQVLVVPTQFLADHLEVLYDIDVAGGEEAEECGITMVRTAMPNDDPDFITALAEVVVEHARSGETHAEPV